jgi:hypothetical protein
LDRINGTVTLIMSVAEIKKQVEFYLSDANLAKDKFFNNKIKEDAEGWLPIACLLNCNKIKTMKVKSASIVEALKTSEEVEVHKDGNQVRRKGNKSVPALGAAPKKRDDKAAAKEESKEEEEEEVNNGFLMEEDFNSPHVVRFESKSPIEEGKKVDWKGIVDKVKVKCPKVKVPYVRSDA